MMCVLIYVFVSWVELGPAAKYDSAGKQLCNKCFIRLSKVPHHRPNGTGRACSPQCKAKPSSTNSSTPSSAPSTPTSTAITVPVVEKKKRKRNETDELKEGEETETHLTSQRNLRVRAVKPIVPDKKKLKLDKDAAILAELDKMHAARIAALELNQLKLK